MMLLAVVVWLSFSGDVEIYEVYKFTIFGILLLKKTKTKKNTKEVSTTNHKLNIMSITISTYLRSIVAYLPWCCLFVVCFMKLDPTYNNISDISWRSVLWVGKIGGPGENHRPVASH